ncbi:MAG: ATP-binding protein [Pyrinomonadaceae bacterium]
MRTRVAKPILARTPPDRFVGREAALDQLYLRAVSNDRSRPLLVTGSAGVGISELLRQLYDRLFSEQRFVVPFYFALDARDETAKAAATRFLQQFLLQVIAFRRQDAGLIAASPDICELAKLAPLTDAEWVNRMCEACRVEGPLNDDRAFIQASLTSPIRASAAGKFRTLVIVDDLHESKLLENGDEFVNALGHIAQRSGIQFLFASRSSFRMPLIAEENFEVGRLGRKQFSDLAARMAADLNVTVNDETRDLIAVQLAGRPRFLELFLHAAGAKSGSLATFRDVQQLYSQELLHGRLGAYFDRTFARSTTDPVLRQRLFEALFHTIGNGDEAFPLSALRERLGIEAEQLSRIIERLEIDEVLDVATGTARLKEDATLRDFLFARYRASLDPKAFGAVAAQTITRSLKRAPKLMSNVYRREAAIGLRDLLLSFDTQKVPDVLLDYRRFRENLKGLTADEIRIGLATETDRAALPQISHAAAIIDHLPEFGEVTEPERAVIGVGFVDRNYNDDNEVAWFAAEIDSKLEADYALTKEWIDRLEAAAAELGYSNYRIWLVGPEGFADSALDLITDHNGIGSSRRQAEFLREFLVGRGIEEGLETSEYEIVIPVGDDTELIAVHAFEEIARRSEFLPKAVNQIKTALVEACINIAEHSLSPDRKIHQRFVIDKEKVVITISNRGLRFAEQLSGPDSNVSNEGRRGWGLGLIRTLMDEVRVEPVDDGTRITMTKYLKTSQ